MVISIDDICVDDENIKYALLKKNLVRFIYIYMNHSFSDSDSFDALSLKEQEYFGWAGNIIFIVAQMFQIHHTFKRKETRDISYGLQILFCIGDGMYTVFGALDDSDSMLIGNGISLGLACIQMSQKVYYDNYYTQSMGYQQIN